jgi:hypothetical protein
LICKVGSCTGAVGGTSAPNIAPAITTNAPVDQILSIANLPNPASKRNHRRIIRVDQIIKWVADADPEDPISIRQLDFTDPNSLYPATEDKSSKEQWYISARRFVEIERPGNTVFAVGEFIKKKGAPRRRSLTIQTCGKMPLPREAVSPKAVLVF